MSSKYVVIWQVLDIGCFERMEGFKNLDDACRFAYFKGGRVFGLNPEYEYRVEVSEVSRPPGADES